MCKMIINADDFGYCRAVNFGILDAHLNGVLTSTTLLTNAPGFEHAVALAKQHPSLGVGLHLNIAFGLPLTAGASLSGSDGLFIKPKNLSSSHTYDPAELQEELEAQYQKFIQSVGRKPTHLDSHLFTTDRNPVMAAASKILAGKYALPLRNHDIPGFPHVDFIQYRTYQAEPGLSYVRANVNDIASHQFVELMSHPAYVDSYLMASSTYNIQRLDEFDFLTDESTKQMIKDSSIELIHYGNLKQI